MAKGARGIIILKSSESDHRYSTFKNKRNTTARLKVKKYDPKVRRHVDYTEAK